MSELTKLREITDKTREILINNNSAPLSLEELYFLVVKEIDATRNDVKVAIWRLVDNQEAKFISNKVIANIENIKWLEVNRKLSQLVNAYKTNIININTFIIECLGLDLSKVQFPQEIFNLINEIESEKANQLKEKLYKTRLCNYEI